MPENDLLKTDEQTMRGRIVLVTGASRGIGAATAKLFAAHGAAVGVNYHLREAEARNVVAEIEAAGGKALAVRATVNDEEQVDKMVKQVEDSLGPIDTLVMNAVAVSKFTFAPFLEYQWDTFQSMVLGELAGIYFPARAIAPLMVQRKNGNLIAVSSNASRSPWEGSIAHAAGKSGVDGMVKVMARELGPHNIRVNAVAPGMVETDATTNWTEERKQMVANLAPLRRIAKPEDVAGAILLLASDEARYITGTYLTVNGGLFMP